jgi:hypothetical protein
MAKSLMFWLFGLGRVPARVRPEIEREGVELLDEGLSGTVTLRHFRSPRRRASFRRNWFCGSLVVTGQRFAAYGIRNSLIEVPLQAQQLGKLDCSLEGDNCLCVE